MPDERAYRRRMGILMTLVFVLLLGATVYHYVEGWKFLDALYFSAYTMTTVGYGDFTPKTDIGKAFTIFYVFTGVGIGLYGLSLLASHYVEQREEFILEKVGKVRIKHRALSFFDKVKNLFSYDPKKITEEASSTKKN